MPSRTNSAIGFGGGSQRNSFLPWDSQMGMGAGPASSDFNFAGGFASSSAVGGGYGLGDVADLELGGEGDDFG